MRWWILLFIVTCFLMVAADEFKQITLAQPYKSSFSPFDHCETEVVPPSSQDIPEYVINLDLTPGERWKPLINDKKNEIIALIENIKHNCNLIFGHNLFWMVDELLPHLTETLPPEYKEELNGIASTSGLNLGEITLFNVFYEFFSACTSIVAQSQDGVMYHGRNLDFGLFLGWDAVNHTWQTSNLLKPLIIKLRFVQNNGTLYRAVSYAGYTGILTALRPGKFALSIDERFRLNGGYIGIIEWIFGKRKQQWLGFLTRRVMEKCSNYNCAQKMLATAPLVAPVYFILSGTSPKEGCVITRGRKNFNIWPLGQKHRNQTGDWFLVETNFDHWKNPPIVDNRRTPAVFCMDQLGNENVPKSLANVLSTRPVLNKLTTYSAIMSADMDMLVVWIQSCPDPCWPW